MNVEQSYYGDFKVVDELPFDLFALEKARTKIYWDFGTNVVQWPITIDFNEKTGYWEIWFTRPVSDQEYVEKMQSLPDEL